MYKSILWHTYKAGNISILQCYYESGVFWTYRQWKSINRKVKKGIKWIPLKLPIFDQEDKNKIKYTKTFYVFEKTQTEKIKKQK